MFHSLEQACLREEGISFPNFSWTDVCPTSCWKRCWAHPLLGILLGTCWLLPCLLCQALASHSSSRGITGLIRAKSPRAIEGLFCAHPAIPFDVPRTNTKMPVSCWTGTTTCRVIDPHKFCWSKLWGPICVSFYCGIKLNKLRVIWACNTTNSFYGIEPFGKKLTSAACLTQLNCTWHRGCQKILVLHDKGQCLRYTYLPLISLICDIHKPWDC